jgi:F420-non-reducing hydrogenase iron-sulfur subunit
METFEPVIVAFCCHYCAYTAADMAGTMRLDYPANVKIVRVPCSGKVDTLHMLKALEKVPTGCWWPDAWKAIATSRPAMPRLRCA